MTLHYNLLFTHIDIQPVIFEIDAILDIHIIYWHKLRHKLFGMSQR